jgi:hypothetical protein
VILWTLDPAERDAVLANEGATKWQPGSPVLVEIACARGSAQLFAVRQAYHDRFKRSLEEDVAAHVTGDFRKVYCIPLFCTTVPRSAVPVCALLQLFFFFAIC